MYKQQSKWKGEGKQPAWLVAFGVNFLSPSLSNIVTRYASWLIICPLYFSFLLDSSDICVYTLLYFALLKTFVNPRYQHLLPQK